MVSIQINKSGYHQVVQTPGGRMVGSGRCKKNRSGIYIRDIASSVYHTRSLVRRIVHNNFISGKTSFLTLTFHSEIFSDYDLAVYEFTKFMKRLNYVFFGKKSGIKYLCVPERQERGVWHFHVLLFDFPYFDVSKIEKIWGFGFVKINQVRDANNIAIYIMKYITKEMIKNIQKGRKKIFTSRGLERGFRVSMDELYEGIHLWLQFISDQKDVRLVFSKENLNENGIRILYEVYFSASLYSFVKDFLCRRVRGMRRLFLSDDDRLWRLRQISKIAMEVDNEDTE